MMCNAKLWRPLKSWVPKLLVLRQENETLIERLGVQERLLRMVAHELRTPLTASKLALQSLNLGQIDQTRFRDVLGRRLDDIEQLGCADAP